MDAATCLRRAHYSERYAQQREHNKEMMPHAMKWQSLQHADPIEKMCTVYRLIEKEEHRKVALHRIITTKRAPLAVASWGQGAQENEKQTILAVVQELPVGIQEQLHSTLVKALSGEKRTAGLWSSSVGLEPGSPTGSVRFICA